MSCGFKREGGVEAARLALESLVRALFITGTPFTRIERVTWNDESDAWVAL